MCLELGSLNHESEWALSELDSIFRSSGLYVWRMRTRFSAFLARFEWTRRRGKNKL